MTKNKYHFKLKQVLFVNFSIYEMSRKRYIIVIKKFRRLTSKVISGMPVEGRLLMNDYIARHHKKRMAHRRIPSSFWHIFPPNIH